MTGEHRANELAFGAPVESPTVATDNFFFELKQSQVATSACVLTNAQAIPVQVPATRIDTLSSFSTQTLSCSDMEALATPSRPNYGAVFARLFSPMATELQGLV